MWQVETPTPHLGGRSLFRGGVAFRARLLDRADDLSARGRLDGRAGAARRAGLPGRPGPAYEREDREVRPGLSVRRGDAGRGNRGTRSGGKGTDRDAGIRRRRLPEQPVLPRAPGGQVRGVPEGGRTRERDRSPRKEGRLAETLEGDLLALREGGSGRRGRRDDRLRHRSGIPPRADSGHWAEKADFRGGSAQGAPSLRGQASRGGARFRLEPRRTGEAPLRADRWSGTRSIRPAARRSLARQGRPHGPGPGRVRRRVGEPLGVAHLRSSLVRKYPRLPRVLKSVVKRTFALPLIALLLLAPAGCARRGGTAASAAPSASPSASSGARRYAFRGIVRSVDPAEQEVTVADEAVPGLMDAMTMSF